MNNVYNNNLEMYQENKADPDNPSIRYVQAYVCKFLPRAGKLDAEKCVEFGVPTGPLFGELKAGKT